jgi:hypothetical protein
MKEGLPSELIPLNVLRSLISSLTSSAEVLDMDKNLQNEGKFLTKNTTVSGFKVMGEGIGNDVRISNDLTVKFQLNKIIFPFKFGKNIFSNNNNNNWNFVAII